MEHRLLSFPLCVEDFTEVFEFSRAAQATNEDQDLYLAERSQKV